MHVEINFHLATLYGFLLVLARVSGVFAFVPIPGISAGTPVSRVVLSLMITIALSPLWPAPQTDLMLGSLLGWMGAEAAFGLTIGIAVSFLLEGVQMAAQIIGLQAGYSFASTVDPNTQADTTTLQLMAQLFAGSMFFILGFDRALIRILAQSLNTVPAGNYSLSGTAAAAITRLGSGIFSIGLQLAIPVLGLMLMLDIAIAILGRLQTQLQLISLAFAIKMLVGVAFLSGLWAFFPAVFEKAGAVTLATLLKILTH